MDYEQCKYFIKEDVDSWHGDIFDHPSYKTFCTKTGNKKELLLPVKQCNRCHCLTEN